MGNDGGYKVCFITSCIRRAEKSWTVLSLGWADEWGTRATKVIGLDTLGREC